MFAELLLYALTRAARPARRVGLVRENIGLWSRGRRQRAAWAAHEAQCHAVVRQAIAGLTRRRTVVVLGSGLARDVPMTDLIAMFDKVVLVDAVHSPAVKLRLRRDRQVSFVESDLSGALPWLLGEASERGDPLSAWRDDPAVDLVISANMLSQLPIRPAEWLENNPAREKVLPADFLDRLIGWHLADLQALRCRVCLLTDTVMEERDGTGAVTDTLDLMRGARLPLPDAMWEWVVAPFGEIDRDHEYVHAARGYGDLHAAFAAMDKGRSLASEAA
ncbi:MAG: hypothetical protein ACRCUX_11975 [Beijerinckiaceae bacterium]